MTAVIAENCYLQAIIYEIWFPKTRNVIASLKSIYSELFPETLFMSANQEVSLKVKDIDTLYRDYSDAIKRYIYRLCKDRETTEDLLQETFVSAIKYQHTYSEEKSSFYTWVCRIARNAYFRSLKKEKKYSHIELSPEAQLDIASPDEHTQQVENEILVSKVKEIVNQLPEPEKSIIMYKQIDRCSMSETADRLGISTRTVSRRLISAQNLIRNELRKQGLL